MTSLRWLLAPLIGWFEQREREAMARHAPWKRAVRHDSPEFGLCGIIAGYTTISADPRAWCTESLRTPCVKGNESRRHNGIG